MTKPLPPENIYGHTKKLQYILDHLHRYAAKHEHPVYLLDFGCGNGSAVSQYLIQPNFLYYGVDIHQPSLEYARNHFAAPNAFFLDHIPDEILFDIVVYADNLEHLDDPAAILRSHHGLLKEGGIIIGSVPNGYGPFEVEKKIDQWLGLSLIFLRGFPKLVRETKKLLGKPVAPPEFLPYNIESGHVQFFTRASLYRLVEETGFQVIDFAHGAFVGAPFSEQLFLSCERIALRNVEIADRLPHWAVSTWYFVARKVSRSEDQPGV